MILVTVTTMIILMVLIVLGSYLAGIWGIILIAPLTATIVEIYKYARKDTLAIESEASFQDTSDDLAAE